MPSQQAAGQGPTRTEAQGWAKYTLGRRGGTVHTQVQGWAQYTLGRRGRHRKHSGAGVGTVHTQAQVWAQ